jgi:putative membrane protein
MKSMKRSHTPLLAAAIAAALAAGPAWSQGSSASPATGATGSAGTTASPGARAGADAKAGTSKGGELAKADREFVMQAAMAGMAEVQAGELAAKKADSAEVKRFGQKMVDDHGAANAELMKIASDKGVTPPSSLDKAHRAAMDALQKTSGDAFDRTYMQRQVADHQKAIALYERQAKSGRDAELRQFAEKQLPTLREHLKMARSDMDAMARGGSGGADRSAAGTGRSGTPGAPGSGMTSGSTGSGGERSARGEAGGSGGMQGGSGTGTTSR